MKTTVQKCGVGEMVRKKPLGDKGLKNMIHYSHNLQFKSLRSVRYLDVFKRSHLEVALLTKAAKTHNIKTVML